MLVQPVWGLEVSTRPANNSHAGFRFPVAFQRPLNLARARIEGARHGNKGVAIYGQWTHIQAGTVDGYVPTVSLK
jgi:hypothetical protein